MFRNRYVLAALLAVAILPLVGCANRRCCYPTGYAARPVYAAPGCSSCGASPAGAAPIAVDP
ncbi:MAG TPA: hypothetical protein VKE40_14820 [Gemmataceae bacterium]|nr:hypothetical protein [Gemmataceae bacterium]